MSEEILVPILGESITEATVAKWLKNEGDVIQADEPIVELETDKVNLEVPSPIDGILSEIKSKDGDTVEVGSILGLVSQTGSEIKKNETIEVVQRGGRGQTQNPNLHFGSIEKHSGYSLDQLISIFGSKL